MELNLESKRASNLGHRWQMCQKINPKQKCKMWFYEFSLLLRVEQKTLLSVSKKKKNSCQIKWWIDLLLNRLAFLLKRDYRFLNGLHGSWLYKWYTHSPCFRLLSNTEALGSGVLRHTYCAPCPESTPLSPSGTLSSEQQHHMSWKDYH